MAALPVIFKLQSLSTIKMELIHQTTYPTREEAMTEIFFHQRLL